MAKESDYKYYAECDKPEGQRNERCAEAKFVTQIQALRLMGAVKNWNNWPLMSN